MIAGSLAILAEPVADGIEDYHDSGQRAVEVSLEDQATLDGDTLSVQAGTVAGSIKTTRNVVTLDGHKISEETRDTSQLVASDWVADVTGGGWILSESTRPSDREHKPAWPFSLFETLLGVEIFPVNVDPGGFAQRQQDADRDTATEFVGKRTGEDDVTINWGKEASTAKSLEADVGVALTTFWRGEFVRVIVYQSGYIAAWEPEDWAPSAFARFVEEEVLPVTYVPDDDEDDGQQVTLSDTGGSDFEERVADHLDREGVDVERGGE